MIACLLIDRAHSEKASIDPTLGWVGMFFCFLLLFVCVSFETSTSAPLASSGATNTSLQIATP